jgi:hypothetical protein
VVRVAIQNAASVAALLITTEAMVAEVPKKNAGTAEIPSGGGMGGMGYGLLTLAVQREKKGPATLLGLFASILSVIMGWPAPLGSDRLGSLCFEKREERTDDDFRAWN